MALIKCPECGSEISDMATSCPQCGYPIQEYFDDTPYDVISNHETKKCVHCGRDIPKRIAKCPYCGKSQIPTWATIIFAIFVVMFLFTFFSF